MARKLVVEGSDGRTATVTHHRDKAPTVKMRYRRPKKRAGKTEREAVKRQTDA